MEGRSCGGVRVWVGEEEDGVGRLKLELPLCGGGRRRGKGSCNCLLLWTGEGAGGGVWRCALYLLIPLPTD